MTRARSMVRAAVRVALLAVVLVVAAGLASSVARAEPSAGARPRVLLALAYRSAAQPDSDAGALGVAVRVAPWLSTTVAVVAGRNHQLAGLEPAVYEARAGAAGRWCDRAVKACGLVRLEAGYLVSTLERQGSGRHRFDWSGPVIEPALGGEVRVGRVRAYLAGLVRVRIGEDYDASEEKLGETAHAGVGIELGVAVGL